MARSVTLVLVDADGAPLGALPPVRAQVPHWPEVWDVVAGVRERFGVRVTLLRIVATEPGRQHGGAVTYLAELAECAGAGRLARVLRPVPALPAGALAEHSLRAPYARPGGAARSLRWAAATLDRLGRGPILRHEQRKTWNLSAIWRLTTPSGPIWLKEVPPFFAHEAAVLAWLAEHGLGDLAVGLLAAQGGRMLLAHLSGPDLFRAGLATRLRITDRMHMIQVAASTRVPALLAAAVPDGRVGPLTGRIRAVAAAHRRREVADLVAGLDERLAAVTACGLPETLIHGDLHPGNARGDRHRPVLLDWGDSAVAHPAFDLLRLADGLSRAAAAEVVDAWVRRWCGAVPGADPRRALDLLRPVAALRNATVYANFLANIEPSEHRYHAADVDDWLARAVE